MLGMSKRSSSAGHAVGDDRVELRSERRRGVARRRSRPSRTSCARRGRGTARGSRPSRPPWRRAGTGRARTRSARRWASSASTVGAVEEAGERRQRRLQPVVELGPVRHAAPRADVEDRLVAARLVAQRAVAGAGVDEATAPPLGHEHDEVGERLPEAEGDDVGARAQDGQVLLGGVAGGDVDEARGRCARRCSAPPSGGSVSRWPSASTTLSTTSSSAAPSSTTRWRPSGSSTHVDGRRDVVDDARCPAARRPAPARGTTRGTPTARAGSGTSCRRASGSRRRRRAGRAGRASRRRPSRPTRRATGPGRIGPAQRTDSSVNIVTSSAIEFIHSRGCWSGRQTRPSPRRCGSTRWMRSGAPASSSALATRRSTSDAAVGPAPTTASSRVGIEPAYVKVDLIGRDCVVAGPVVAGATM